MLDAIDEDYQDVSWNGSLWYPSPYKGPPTPEVNLAWHDLMQCKRCLFPISPAPVSFAVYSGLSRWPHQRIGRGDATGRPLSGFSPIPRLCGRRLPRYSDRHAPYPLPVLYLARPSHCILPLCASQESRGARNVRSALRALCRLHQAGLYVQLRYDHDHV